MPHSVYETHDKPQDFQIHNFDDASKASGVAIRSSGTVQGQISQCIPDNGVKWESLP